MTDDQLAELVRRVGGGEGVEAIIASMGLDSNRTCDWLKKHQTARSRINAAKAAAIESRRV